VDRRRSRRLPRGGARAAGGRRVRGARRGRGWLDGDGGGAAAAARRGPPGRPAARHRRLRRGGAARGGGRPAGRGADLAPRDRGLPAPAGVQPGARVHREGGALGRVPGRVALIVAAVAGGIAVERAAGLHGVTAVADLLAGVALLTCSRGALSTLTGV